MYDYQIIQAPDIPTLIKLTNKKFKEGYVACGGFSKIDDSYCQAIAHPYRYFQPN